MVLQNVESDSLRQGSALSNGDSVSLLDEKGGRAMRRGVAVTLLVTVVLLDVVQRVAAHNHRLVHLVGHNASAQNAAANGNTSGPRALLVNVLSRHGQLGRLEAQTNVLVEARRLRGLLGQLANSATMLSILEDRRLLQVRSLVLKTKKKKKVRQKKKKKETLSKEKNVCETTLPTT